MNGGRQYRLLFGVALVVVFLLGVLPLLRVVLRAAAEGQDFFSLAFPGQQSLPAVATQANAASAMIAITFFMRVLEWFLFVARGPSLDCGRKVTPIF